MEISEIGKLRAQDLDLTRHKVRLEANKVDALDKHQPIPTGEVFVYLADEVDKKLGEAQVVYGEDIEGNGLTSEFTWDSSHYGPGSNGDRLGGKTHSAYLLGICLVSPLSEAELLLKELVIALDDFDVSDQISNIALRAQKLLIK